jgi:transposase
MSGGAAFADASWGGRPDGVGLRADHRASGAVQCGKQIACYLGLVPLEDSSGQRRRLGHITKQGNSLVRFLLVEAAQVSVRSLPEWRSKYCHMALRRGRKIAKVAMARKLAVRLYWMMRKEWDYEQLRKFGSHAGQPGHRDGVT